MQNLAVFFLNDISTILEYRRTSTRNKATLCEKVNTVLIAEFFFFKLAELSLIYCGRLVILRG